MDEKKETIKPLDRYLSPLDVWAMAFLPAAVSSGVLSAFGSDGTGKGYAGDPLSRQ